MPPSRRGATGSTWLAGAADAPFSAEAGPSGRPRAQRIRAGHQIGVTQTILIGCAHAAQRELDPAASIGIRRHPA